MRTQSTSQNDVTFEHPLNDQLRICLQLEQLKQQFEQSLNLSSDIGSQTAITTLLKTANVIERPDIKSKLSQALTQQASTLAQLEQFPQVDQSKLRKLLDDLDQMANQLHNHRGKIGEDLRQNEFLSQIRLQQNSPAGACYFRLPAYAAWIAQPIEYRSQDLMRWAGEYQKIQNIALMILKVTRSTASSQTSIAQKGNFQMALDPSLTPQLIQVKLSGNSNIFPEISVGRHRLIIRFLEPSYHDLGRATQSTNDIQFSLSCCR